MYNIPLLLAAPAQGATQGSPQGSMVLIVQVFAIFAIFWFLIIRPQRKKQRDAKAMIAAIKKGDQATSIGGIRGTVKSVYDDAVVLEVNNTGTTLEFVKSAISSVEQKNIAPKTSATKSSAPKVSASKASTQKASAPKASAQKATPKKPRASSKKSEELPKDK